MHSSAKKQECQPEAALTHAFLSGSKSKFSRIICTALVLYCPCTEDFEAKAYDIPDPEPSGAHTGCIEYTDQVRRKHRTSFAVLNYRVFRVSVLGTEIMVLARYIIVGRAALQRPILYPNEPRLAGAGSQYSKTKV